MNVSNIKSIHWYFIEEKHQFLSKIGVSNILQASKIKMILIMLISFIWSTHQATVAEYYFANIASTTVQSSVDPLTQPNITFPSKF